MMPTFKNIKNNRGFIALISVLIISGMLLLSGFAVLGGAVVYADATNKRELRIQARLNVLGCLDSIMLMAVKDYFLEGPVHLKDFGCTGTVSRLGLGRVTIKVQTNLQGVNAGGTLEVSIQADSVTVVSQSLW